MVWGWQRHDSEGNTSKHCWFWSFNWICWQFPKVPAFSFERSTKPEQSITLKQPRSISKSTVLFVRPADRLWSHFSLFHHFDSVAALWLCGSTVRLITGENFLLLHCTQGAYPHTQPPPPPAGRQPQTQLFNNSSCDAARTLESRPANRRDSYFKPHIAAPGTPLSSPVPSLCREIKIPESAALHDVTETPNLTESREEMAVRLMLWIHECAIVARKHCQIRWNFKGTVAKLGHGRRWTWWSCKQEDLKRKTTVYHRLSVIIKTLLSTRVQYMYSMLIDCQTYQTHHISSYRRRLSIHSIRFSK